MDARCKDPTQMSIRKEYLGQLKLPGTAYAVEFGSGTGHVIHELITIARAARAHGIEPSSVMVERAQGHFSDELNLTFSIGDAKKTGLQDDSVDLVLMHTLLCHVPESQDAISEAFRVLKRGGTLAVCDGDYDTATTRISDFDPLVQVVRFMINQNVTNLWIMRQIRDMSTQAGFKLGKRIGHGHLAGGDAKYFLTVIERGADRMAKQACYTRQQQKL